MSTSSTVAIVGGRVVPVASAPIENGTIVIVDGLISAVGAAIEVPDDATVIDASGHWVLPGFVDAHTHVGINEESGEMAGSDTNEASRPIAAGTRAIDAINIDDDGFRDALMGGVTTLSIKPGSGNPIGGQTTVMKAWGGRTVDEQALVLSASVKAALGENPKSGDTTGGPVSRLGVASMIRQAFEDARHYASQLSSDNRPRVDLDLAALVPVLAGEIPLDVHAHSRDDIATAMRIAKEFGARLVLNHGTDAGPLAEIIAERGVPVIVGPVVGARLKPELGKRTWTTAARLARGGVRVSIMTDHPEVPIRTLATQAAFCIMDGFDEQAALEAITVNPAAIYGVEGRVGALAPGLDADVAVWTGDPFDPRSRVRTVLIDGTVVLEDGIVVERAD